MEPNQQSGIFLNGKAQIIEMLQYMDPADKKKLLHNIQLRNPALADELINASLSFSEILDLSDDQLKAVMTNVPPAIIGMALKNQNEDFQRRVLGAIPRNAAEEAFSILRNSMANEKSYTERSQKKILDTFISLRRSRRLAL